MENKNTAIEELIQKDIKIITRNVEEKIPQILNNLQNEEESIENKLKILNFFKILFQEITYNMDIVNKFISNNETQKLSLYKILLKEYFNSKEENKEYRENILSLLNLMIQNVLCGNEVFEYLFSFITHHINIINGNIEKEKEEELLNPNKFNNFLKLVSYFYLIRDIDTKLSNYFYFSGNSDSELRINNKNNILNFNPDSILNILIFFELKLSPDEIKNLFTKHISKLINIKLSYGDNIYLNIDKENILTGSFTNDILYKFNQNEMNSCLIKCENINENLELEIYINNNKIEYKLDNKISLSINNNKNEIEYISFFKLYTGICPSIIIYKNDKKNDYLKIFENKNDNKYKYGIYKEELFDKLNNNEIITNTLNFTVLEENDTSNSNILNSFYNDLISIYIPSRFEIDELNDNKIMIRDSINNLDGELITENSKSIGVYIYDKNLNDLSSIDCINSLLPILEFMTENYYVLSQNNLNDFFLILANVFNSERFISNQKDEQFFTCLSLFIEKIPNEFFDDDTKSLFITLSNSIINLLDNKNHFMEMISNQYHIDIFLNKNILSKFSYQNQKSLLIQLHTIKTLKNNSIKIKVSKLISLILFYDKQFKYKFCCKEHADFFKIENNINIKIREQEINEIFEEIYTLIDIIYKYDFQSDLNEIYKLLTLPISPCVQNFIIRIFSNFLSISKTKTKMELFDTLNSNNILLYTSLYAMTISLFDVRIKLLVFILEILDDFEKRNSLVEINEIKDIEIFIENNIIPKYYIAKTINNNNYEEFEIIKQKIQILNYEKIELNDIENNFFQYINKDNYHKLLSNLLSILNKWFIEKKYISYIIPFIISLSPKSEIETLQNSIYNLNKEKEQSKIVNKRILEYNDCIHLFLETYFQSFLYLKDNNYKTSFYINELHSSNEIILPFMNQIYKNGNELINYILTTDIKKLDYIILWGKYYSYLFSKDKDLYNNLREFINQLLQNTLNTFDEYYDKLENFENNIQKYSDFLYYFGILFEFLTFFKYNYFDLNNEIYDENLKLLKFSEYFYYFSIPDFNDNSLIEEKWYDYTNFKTIYSNFFYKLWHFLSENTIDFNFEEYLIQKQQKNIFSNTLKYLYFSFPDITNLCNNGIKPILVLFHYLNLIIVKIQNKNDIEYWVSHYQEFILFLIYSSGNLDKKEKNYSDYHQLNKSILFYSISILITQIINRKNNEEVNYYYSCLGNILYLCFKIYDYYKKEKIKEENKTTTRIFYLFKGKNDINFSSTFPVLLFNEFFSNSNITYEKIIFDLLNSKDKIYKNEINKLIDNLGFNYFFVDNEKNKFSVLKEVFPFLNIYLKREKEIDKIIPCYDNSIYKDKMNPNINICTNIEYEKKSSFDFIKLLKNISNNHKNLYIKIKIEKLKGKYHKALKLNKYKKYKKNLFFFNNYWSTKEFFYNKDKYHLCYKLKNHLSDEYTRVLLTPIIDMKSYIPKFSHFNVNDLFLITNPNKKTIYSMVNLDLNKYLLKDKKEQKSNDALNINYILSRTNSNLLSDKSYDYEKLVKDFIISEKFNCSKIENNQLLNIKKCCLVFHNYHITGMFYNNEEEIGFYSFQFQRKDSEEDYDEERECCFGSIFKPQKEKTKYYHITIPYDEIEFILKRRYIFKRNSFEIYTMKKKSYFFKFEEEIETIITNIKKYLEKNKNFQIEDIKVEYLKYFNIIGYVNKSNIKYINEEKNSFSLLKIYENWKNYKISNLKMLMLLNIYSNRTYNDLTQYPIFPWLYIEYKNNNFDINNKQNYRPLDTPMGMLEINEESLNRKYDYINHWNLIDEDDIIDDNYQRYGSHYSNSLYVTYYLVRIFPFAFDKIELQGNTFDDPNRLFNDFENSFVCSSTQKSDLRELIPEIFSLPELFKNNNNFNFGNAFNIKNKKIERVQNVTLPNWCDNEYSFIYKFRLSLESKFVSLKLNNWFDLIFGYYQKNEKAKSKFNLYSIYTYEEYEEEYNKLKDIHQKKYASRMIEFGITPNQIFKKLTTPRLDFEEIENKNFKIQICNNFNNYNSSDFYEIITIINNNKFICEDFQYLKFFEVNNYYTKFKLFVICFNSVYSFEIYRRNNKNDDNENSRLYTMENIIKYNLINTKNRMSNNLKKIPSILFGKGEYIALGGFWNGNIIIQKLVKDNISSLNYKIIYESNYPITNIIIDQKDNFSICSDIKGNIYIFIIDKKEKKKWNIYKKIQNCYYEIISMDLNEKLNIFVTYSKDNICMIYTYPKFILVNSFKLYNMNEEIFANKMLVSFSPLPSYLFYSEKQNKLYVYSINGEKYLEKKIDKVNNLKIFNNSYSQDYIYLNENNCIKIFSMPDLNNIHTFNLKPDDEIYDMDISEDKSFISILTKENNEKTFSIKIFKHKKTKV